MKERDGTKRLGDRVEMDDAYIGGERARKKGKSGRGAMGKTPFIAAVQTNELGHPMSIALFKVSGFSSAGVAKFARQKLTTDADVVSDGLPCFAPVSEQGCSHSYKVTGSSRKSAEDPTFRWVNTALGNIKSALTGTYRQVAPKHVPRYLSEFQYRFNRRYDLAGMLTRLCHSAVRTPPMPYRLLVMAESSA